MKRFDFSVILIVLLAGLLFSFPVFSQNTDFTKENFPTQKKELQKAIKNIKKGDALLDMDIKGAYAQALDYYLQANNFNHNNAWLNLKIGICYVKSFYKNLSLPFLQNAFVLDSTISNALFLYLGEAYHYNSSFDKALKYYKQYRATLAPQELQEESEWIDKRIKECESGKILTENPNVSTITNLSDKVNSMWDDYCTVVNGDETVLAFTSRRKNTTGGKINSWDLMYYEDIYFTYKSKTGAWGFPENPGKPLNGATNDATVDISPDGNIITIYKNQGGQDVICESQKTDNIWSKPIKLSKQINSKRFHQPSATYSKDRKTIYFVSDKKGGFGGSDIYISHLNDDGSWSEAKNIGNVVNTPYGEDAPCLFDDSTLYFSSRGHNSIGGFDIFVAKIRPNGEWTAPVNLGLPLNSAGDDMYLILAQSGDGYFSSDRQNGFGGMDIYHAKFNLKVEDLLANVSPVFMWGYLQDGSTGEGVKADIKVSNTTDNKLVYKSQTDSVGQFALSLPSMKNFQMNVHPVDCQTKDIKIVTETGTVYTSTYDPKNNPTVPPIVISGVVTDEATGTPFQFPIEIIDIKESTVAARAIPDSNGAFSVTLPSATSYRLNMTASGCAHKAITVLQPDNFTDNMIEGVNVRLENIYFDFDQAFIRPDAIEILNRHSDLFNSYPKWKVLVTGHTDNMGSETYNVFLSKKRAKTVADYLVSRGVKRSRIKYEGRGFSKPSVDNTTEEGRQLNRRCEFQFTR